MDIGNPNQLRSAGHKLSSSNVTYDHIGTLAYVYTLKDTKSTQDLADSSDQLAGMSKLYHRKPSC